MSSSSSSAINFQNWAAFAEAMCGIREIFPEHAKEIDKCIYSVGQKLPSCSDPNCTCQMTFENFRAISHENARRTYEFD